MAKFFIGAKGQGIPKYTENVITELNFFSNILEEKCHIKLLNSYENIFLCIIVGGI